MRRHYIVLFAALFLSAASCHKKSAAKIAQPENVAPPTNLLGYAEIPNGNSGSVPQLWVDTVMPGQGAQVSQGYISAIQGFVGSMVRPAESVDMSKPVRLFALKSAASDDPLLVLMAHKVGELSTEAPNIVMDLESSLFLVGSKEAVAEISPFARSLGNGVERHRAKLYPRHVISHYEAEIEQLKQQVSRETQSASTEMPNLLNVVSLYVETLDSVARQFDTLVLSLNPGKAELEVDVSALAGTTAELFFKAQNPAAFDMHERLPKIRPIYGEGDWSMGEAREAIMDVSYKMLQEVDPNQPWKAKMEALLGLFTGKWVVGASVNVMARPPQFDTAIVYETEDANQAYSAVKDYMDLLTNFKPFGEDLPIAPKLVETKSKTGSPVLKSDIKVPITKGNNGPTFTSHIFAKGKDLYYLMGEGGMDSVDSVLSGTSAEPQPALAAKLAAARSTSANSILWMDLGPMTGGAAPVRLTVLTKFAPSKMSLSLELER